MKKLKLNYTCTDPDCAQYMAKVTDTRYSYIEYREWFGNYIVCHAVVDLQDYTLDEICTYCSSYYASLEQMVADYGFRGALQIMAECIFEQLGFDDMEFNAGDAGVDLSWVEKLDRVDAAVLITKCVSPDFFDAALEHKDRLIVHATITGYGHSALEPNVPTPYEEFAAIMELVKAGFPMEKIVIRIDPIIPTEKGLSVAYRTMISFMEMGFQRYRVSVIDMYPHARSRFKKAGLPLPYGDSGFAPSQAQLSKVDDMLRQAKQFWEGLDNGKVLRIESCAEPGLTEPIACGCISDYDLNLLGFSEDAESNGAGYQRKGCMCYAGKTELLKHKTRCPHGCLYCYWKDIKG